MNNMHQLAPFWNPIPPKRPIQGGSLRRRSRRTFHSEYVGEKLDLSVLFLEKMNIEKEHLGIEKNRYSI